MHLTPRRRLEELKSAVEHLDRTGFISGLFWSGLRAGARPPTRAIAEPGEWPPGWQYHVSSSSEFHCRETIVLAQSCAADQALWRSHSGLGASNVLHGAPTELEPTVPPELFGPLVLEPLRLPSGVVKNECECGAKVDANGWHRAACPRSGRLRATATGTERTLAGGC